MNSVDPPITPTIVECIEDAYGAGQRLVVDRIELLALQASETSAVFLRTGAIAGCGAMLIGLGWVCLVGAVLVWLEPAWSWPVALAFVGTMHVAAGGAFLASSRARTSPTETVA